MKSMQDNKDLNQSLIMLKPSRCSEMDDPSRRSQLNSTLKHPRLSVTMRVSKTVKYAKDSNNIQGCEG